MMVGRLSSASTGEATPDLLDYLRTFYSHRFVVALCLLLGIGAAAFYSYSKQNEYQAGATVAYQPQVETALLNINPNINSNSLTALPDQVQLIESPAVAARVVKELGSAAAVQAQVLGSTDDLQILVTDPNPGRAAAEANAYAKGYIFVLNQQIKGLFRATIAGLQHEIGRVQSQLATLDGEIASATRKQGASSGHVLALTQRRDTLSSQMENFQAQLTQLQLDLSVETGGASMLARATPPAAPVGPSHWLDIGLGGVGGLMVGLAGALLLGRFDDGVVSRSDLEREIAPLPMLAAIPSLPEWRPGDPAFLVAAEAPEAMATESYRSLRTALQFIRRESDERVFEVTSPGSADGKTTTVANLGVVLANSGTRTLLVDADLRRPRLKEFFGIDLEVGLTSVLEGLPVERAIQQVEAIPNLSVLPAGPSLPNPAEWLGSARLAAVISSLRRSYEVIIIDTPPVLPVTDATLLTTVVDSTIVVVTSGHTTRRSIHQLVNTFRQVGAPIAGFVLNGVVERPLYGYGYYYRYVKDSQLPGRWLRRPWRHAGGVSEHPKEVVGAKTS